VLLWSLGESIILRESKAEFRFGLRLALRLSEPVVGVGDEVGNEGFSTGRRAQLHWHRLGLAGCILGADRKLDDGVVAQEMWLISGLGLHNGSPLSSLRRSEQV